MARTYTTKELDMVDDIAFFYYGDEEGRTAIYNANEGLADKGLQLPAGLEIIIPDWEKPAPVIPEFGVTN